MQHEREPRKRPLFDLFFSYMDSRKPSDRVIVFLLIGIMVIAGSIGLISLSNRFTTSVPAEGGTLIEGIVGTPRFVNPALALTRVDNDLSALLYSGLMKLDENGVLVPDLAESVTVSEDGLVYNVILRDDVRFHDDTPVRASDVSFTIELLQDPDVKSPLRGNWNGVAVEVLGERELNIVLQNPYTPFIENLTLGIMPEHVWQALSVEELPFSQHNTEPIGSGQFALSDILYNESGFISEYQLVAFQDGRTEPKIKNIVVRFYQNEDELETALVAGEVTATAGLSHERAKELALDGNIRVTSVPLPRVFSVFFNQNKSAVLRDESARRALDAAIDRTALIDTVLAGYGTPASSPIPPSSVMSIPAAAATTSEAASTPVTAVEILEGGGWARDEFGSWTKEIDGAETTLAVTIATANTGVFEDTAYYLEHVWTELGAEVSVELYEQSDLVQSVIRPRDYEALLFGTEIGRALDLYPFWHSSQREDPGLNVALYTNISADTLLQTARTTQDATERTDALQAFAALIESEVPALFLYSPSFIYITREGVELPKMDGLARPHERFSNIGTWHMRVESVWNIFANNN